MFSHKTPIGGTKHLGFISKASHTQDNQYQGKVLPSYQLSPAHPPQHGQKHTQKRKSGRRQRPRPHGSLAVRTSGKPLISKLGEIRIS